MKTNTLFAVPLLALTTSAATPAWAQTPPVPGLTSGLGSAGNGMIHAEVAVQNNAVTVTLRDGPSGPATPAGRLTAGIAGDFDAPFDVLSGLPYNAQYGWLEDQTIGFTPIDIQPGEFVWIEQTGVTGPGTVAVYEGGNGAQMPNHSLDPIFGTPAPGSAGSLSNAWLWDEDFLMQHNWYTFSENGDYDIDYRVYVGDAAGNPIGGYTDATTTFRFTAIPEPTTVGLFSAGALLALRRRKA